jgi:hypothetical protein
MANWICFYSVIGVPCLTLLSFIVSAISEATYQPGSNFATIEFLLGLVFLPICLIIIILFVMGGWRLHQLRTSGIMMLKVALWADLVVQAMHVLLSITIMAAAAASPNQEILDSESGAGGAVIGLLCFALGLASLVFEIVALVWLNRHGTKLPTSG